MRRLIFSCTLLLAIGTGTAYAQDYPLKPIRLITSGIGGSNDIAARLIAQGYIASMGQQVVVENRGSGVVPGQTVAQAPPDGYTLLVAGGSFTIGPLLQKTPYDVVRDFAPISLVAMQPNILTVHPSMPVKSARDLIALAKARPGELNYGSLGNGSSPHLAAELLKSMTGISIVRVNYTNSATYFTDLIGGHVQFVIATASSVTPYAKSSRLRTLAVTSALPSTLAPGLPTIAASGLPGYEFVSITGFYAPTKTAGMLINRLNQELIKFLNAPDVKDKFFNIGVEVVGSTPEVLATTIKSEIARMGKVIREAGIRVE